MASLCHPWFTTTNLSYRFPIFETSATALCGTTGSKYLYGQWWFAALISLNLLAKVWWPAICFLALLSQWFVFCHDISTNLESMGTFFSKGGNPWRKSRGPMLQSQPGFEGFLAATDALWLHFCRAVNGRCTPLKGGHWMVGMVGNQLHFKAYMKLNMKLVNPL